MLDFRGEKERREMLDFHTHSGKRIINLLHLGFLVNYRKCNYTLQNLILNQNIDGIPFLYIRGREDETSEIPFQLT